MSGSGSGFSINPERKSRLLQWRWTLLVLKFVKSRSNKMYRSLYESFRRNTTARFLKVCSNPCLASRLCDVVDKHSQLWKDLAVKSSFDLSWQDREEQRIAAATMIQLWWRNDEQVPPTILRDPELRQKYCSSFSTMEFGLYWRIQSYLSDGHPCADQTMWRATLRAVSTSSTTKDHLVLSRTSLVVKNGEDRNLSMELSSTL